MSTIEHDAEAQQFSTQVDGLRAVLDYRLSGQVMTITHTGVPQPIGRRGVAAQLMREALKVATRAGWEVDPACSYAAAYMRRHPDELKRHEDDSLDQALDESYPASDAPSVGSKN